MLFFPFLFSAEGLPRILRLIVPLITDNIKKIVRRLRLTSSKPFADDLDVNLFGTETETDSTNKDSEPIVLKHTKTKRICSK